MGRRSKRLSERSREVADGKPALVSQICEADLPVQVFPQEVNHSTFLPRCQSTAIGPSRFEGRSVPLCYVSAKQKTEIIQEEFTRRLLGAKRWQDHLCHLMEDFVKGSVLALNILDMGDIEAIRKRV